jgi:hypothetical protein
MFRKLIDVDVVQINTFFQKPTFCLGIARGGPGGGDGELRPVIGRCQRRAPRTRLVLLSKAGLRSKAGASAASLAFDLS